MDDEMLKAIARLTISLPLVAALAYFAIKYGFGRRESGLNRRRFMRVVEQMAIGPKVLLTLVQVGEKYYLLAHQDGSTVLITEYENLPLEINPSNKQENELLKLVNNSMFSRKNHKNIYGENKENDK